MAYLLSLQQQDLAAMFYKVDVLVSVHQDIVAALDVCAAGGLSADELASLFLGKLKSLQIHAEYRYLQNSIPMFKR